jgi:DNA-binding MarR family transcriptional regulator
MKNENYVIAIPNLIIKISNLIERSRTNILKSIPLTSQQFNLLYEIYRLENIDVNASLTTITTNLGYGRAAVSRLSARAENEGLIKKIGEERISTSLQLTKIGKAKLEYALRELASYELQLFEGLTSEQIKLIENLLSRL